MTTVILVVIIIVVIAVFSVQNAATVSLSFLSLYFDASLAVIALLFFLAGMITGMIVLSWTRMRRAAKNKKDEDRKQSTGGKSS